jgi:CBS domain-containing protein
MDHKVEAVMTSQVVTAPPSTPFQELVRLLEQNHITCRRWMAWSRSTPG